MSSQEAAAGSRVLRTRRRNTTKTVAHQAENKSSTKAAKRKTITDSETELVSEKDVLERLGISVGPTTTCEKVLDLLGKHVTKKKPRLLSQLVRSRKNANYCQPSEQSDQLRTIQRLTID
ncbi:uncharacterized protein MELLADRAFT_103384 [Melampsora larici-populina 98AG31]|uniref:Uncharacterized protein n=1 Tax=Melampsora larici-populina (strain 98AG31 / pathotype 3-4-7) TaxID=747676 RepID=F4RBA4_MELLP|nr:uncharacterized protein MELLADRAFT_103384 [Melampsora larici-populina 98AG31]EGG10049.1 hypothetical protein MELLADRAFT_103384 [Melampsora larici-populina 98AG31]